MMRRFGGYYTIGFRPTCQTQYRSCIRHANIHDSVLTCNHRRLPCGRRVSRKTPSARSFRQPRESLAREEGGVMRVGLLVQFVGPLDRQTRPDTAPCLPADVLAARLLMESDYCFEANQVPWVKEPDRTLWELYVRSWLLCLPSTYEGQPCVKVMGHRTPLVAARNPEQSWSPERGAPLCS